MLLSEKLRIPWLIAGLLALTLALSSAPAGAAGSADTARSAVAATPADAQGGTAIAPGSYSVALVTGDTVVLDAAPEGRQTATVDATADGDRVFEMLEIDGDLYAYPAEAAPLIGTTLDRELFNITKLAAWGYGDGQVPVIVAAAPSSGPSTFSTTPGLTPTTTLSSIDATAGTIDTTSDAFWRAVTGDSPQAAGGAGPLAGVHKIWLDGLVTVNLHESVEQIGAPSAWDAGFDGTGVTIAVLDTGVDADHPDLVGKVTAAEVFTGEGTVADGHGHGTHVAATAAGSGAASDGLRTGVAPGADIVNGKVLNDGGSGQESWIIAGMEWAVEDAGADIVNMSLGGGPTDGTDPMSTAVNTLTEEHDALFVISAGNSFNDYTIGTPGAAALALTVGAVDRDDERAAFSSRGPRVGDHAVKPDITGPGVGIVAARADGTAMGQPVDDLYTAASGTSMSAPHLAGAAAILAQQQQGWGASELKSALTGTAIPNDGLTVYEQGGGRVDVPGALEARVITSVSPIDLGYHQYPHDETDPIDVEVTYTNVSDEAIDIELSLVLESGEGDAPADGMLDVSPDSIAIDPGGTAVVTVTLDVSVGEYGLYGGYLVADADDATVDSTPVGFYKESERHDLTVEGIARDGRPAAGISSFDITNVDDLTEFHTASIGFTDGAATVRVPPGNYHVMGVIYTYDGPQLFVQETVMIGDTEVAVTDDTTVVLDAREASRIVIDTPDHETAPRGVTTVGFYRADAQGASASHSWTGAHQPTFAAETDPVSIGAFEFYHRWRLTAPELVASVVEPEAMDLSPALMFGSPPVDGDDELPLVDAGFGSPEELAAVDADGAIALMQRGGPNFAEKNLNAAAAGAVAAIIYNNVSGNFAGTVGADGVIPTMSLSLEEGTALLDLLAAGDVTLRLYGIPVSPYLYDLVLSEPDRIPADLGYVTPTSELATLENAFHSDVPDHTVNEVRHFWRPWSSFSFGFVEGVGAPSHRTEYVVADDTRYAQTVYAEPPFTGAMNEPTMYYDVGQQLDQSWFRAPRRPGVMEGNEWTAGLPVLRDGDTLALMIAEWEDDHPTHWGWLDPGVDTSEFRYFIDGELAATADRPRGEFAMVPEPAEYRLEVDVARDAPWWTTSTQTRTAWTVQSEQPADGGVETLPLLLVDYDLQVNLLNQAPLPSERPGRPSIGLQVRHQAGADGPAIAGARLWTSDDDGATWRQRSGRNRGDGRFTFNLDNRDPEGAQHMSLRIEAWDADGNRISQEISRAYALQQR